MKSILLIIGIAFYLTGCGSSSTTADGITSLSSLPKASGTTTASAAVARNSTKRAGGQLQSATTGTQLDAWYTAFNGQTSKSQTFCQLGLNVKEAIRAASQPDKIACYMGVMEKYASITNWPSDGSDGNYHYVNLSGAGEGGDMNIKFKITKTNGVYSGFEMFSGESSQQTEYVSMVSSGLDITLTSVNYYSGSRAMTHQGRVTVTGSINSSGAWTSAKSIVVEASRAETGAWTRSENLRLALTQYADRFLVQGYSTGSENFGSAYTFTNQVYAYVQLLTPIPLSTLALGEGTAKISMTHSGYGSFSQTRGWNGDTGAPISPSSGADYYSEVSAATLPSAPSSYNTAFATAETWDLTTPAGSTAATANFSAIEADTAARADFMACNTAFGFNEESNWPDCWNLSDN